MFVIIPEGLMIPKRLDENKSATGFKKKNTAEDIYTMYNTNTDCNIYIPHLMINGVTPNIRSISFSL